MKTLALPLLLASGLAVASCDAQLTAQHSILAAEASRLYLIATPKLLLVPASYPFAGSYDSATNTIRLSLSLCDNPVAVRDSTIAHELGHAVTDLYYPTLPPGRDHERQADYYGAHILSRSTSDELLPLLDGYCRSGHARSCDKLATWSYALTH